MTTNEDRERESFAAENVLIENAALCLRDFARGDGSPVMAREFADGLNALDFDEFTGSQSDTLRAACETLEAFETDDTPELRRDAVRCAEALEALNEAR